MKLPPLAGWKERRDLGLVTLNGWSWSGAAALVRALSRDQLNLPLVLLADAGGRVEGGLVLERSAAPPAAETARRLAGDQGCPPPGGHPAVCALMLYPLSASLALPAAALAVLAGEGVAPLALGTSPAALNLVLAQEDMPAATSALATAWGLPPQPHLEVLSVVQSGSRRET